MEHDVAAVVIIRPLICVYRVLIRVMPRVEEINSGR